MRIYRVDSQHMECNPFRDYKIDFTITGDCNPKELTTMITKIQDNPTLLVDNIIPEIKDVKFYANKATVVFWEDNTKTTVVCQDGDIFDKEKGLAMACCKKIYGNKGYFNDIFKKFCH